MGRRFLPLRTAAHTWLLLMVIQRHPESLSRIRLC